MVYLSTKNYRGFGEITNTSDDEVIPLRYTITSEKNVWTDVKSGAQTGEAKEKDKPYASSIFMPLSMTLEDL